ncbi:MAG: pyridoxamine 5'-phosphate oxidase family protein [Chloroflexi bacterium]|nr:pyridoxamine 5'-phosphate oxidase family protein [Chloroflexota bacterium]
MTTQHAVRRSDRAQDDSWIRDFLSRAAFGQVAFVSDGQPYINANIFVYDEAQHAIYLHTAHLGRTPGALEEPSEVCFSTSEMGRLLPAYEAREFSVEYRSVTVFGRARIVRDQEQARAALHLLLDKYAPHLQRGQDYLAVTDEELKYTAVYRIDIDQWSGKAKQVAEDFPGAFWYQG